MNFGHQFYPTPANVISKMIEAIGGVAEKTVLEPSAGNGAIMDKLKYITGKPRAVYGIEIDPTLHAACAAKGHRLIASDFLDFGGRPDIDAILMNPPFDDADTHILHAWAILHSGVIVAQCNIETLTNPHTGERQRLVTLIEKHGSWESLGKCYLQADRKADVEVALVVLRKDAKKLFEFGDGFDKRKAEDFDIGTGSELNFHDPIKARVNQYDAGIQALGTAFEALMKSAEILKPIMNGRDLISMFSEATKFRSGKSCLPDIIDEVTKSAWLDLIGKTRVGDLVSSETRKNWEAEQAKIGQTAFTVANIMKFGEVAFSNAKSLSNEVIVRAFDLLTEHYNDGKNRETIKGKGWKTNAPYRVRQKFIVPWSDSGGYSLVNYYHYERADDIQKAMCLLTGIAFTDGKVKDVDADGKEVMRPWKRFTHYGTRDRIEPYVDEYDSEFFHIKRYGRAGTLHFTFKDLDLWAKFNIAAIRLKGFELTLDNDTNHTGRHWKKKAEPGKKQDDLPEIDIVH